MKMMGWYASHVVHATWRRKSTLLTAILCALIFVIYINFGGFVEKSNSLVHHGSDRIAESVDNYHGDGDIDKRPNRDENVHFVSREKSSVSQPLVDVENDGKNNRISEHHNHLYSEVLVPHKVNMGDKEKKDNGIEVMHFSNTGNIQVPESVGEVVYNQRSQDQFAEQSQPREEFGDNDVNGRQFVQNTLQKPYVPEHRIVHFDLKGAPPKVEYINKVLSMVKEMGATGILLEWEDMFPFTGGMKYSSAKNHYTKKDVLSIIDTAKSLQMEVIPLVQTFGHLEFALKLEHFLHLREVPNIPQALCPSLNDSMLFIQNMIDQVMVYHRGANFVHIGCDEVFQIGECERCRRKPRDNLFLEHITKVAKYVRNKYNATPIVWDDMLRQIPVQTMLEYKLGEVVEPMAWVYAEDVYRFIQPYVWEKFADVFPNIWTASAFKGAFGETLVVPDASRHLENNMKWLEVMSNESPKLRGKFRGIVLTGWQRYDHFAVLCELLPVGLPSLAVNLVAVTHGYFNQTVVRPLYQTMGCMLTPKYETGINLLNDPFLYDKFSWCTFPGSQLFKLTSRMKGAIEDAEDYLKSVTEDKAWMTSYNVRHNFSSPWRVDEALTDFPRVYHGLSMQIKPLMEALLEVYDKYTAAEWMEQKLYPIMKRMGDFEQEANRLKQIQTWPARPFPLLKDLVKYKIDFTEVEKKKPATETYRYGDGEMRSRRQKAIPADVVRIGA